MRKFSVLSSMAAIIIAVFAILTSVTQVESDVTNLEPEKANVQAANGDYQRAVGLATGALSDCLADARKAGNTILDSGAPGGNEGDWVIAFCGRQSPDQSPAQFIGGVRIENWEVVEANCEFPSPTSNPCPTF